MPIKFKDAHKMLLANGWQEAKGGKGSHRKYKKNGESFPLPGKRTGADLSPKVETNLKKILKLK